MRQLSIKTRLSLAAAVVFIVFAIGETFFAFRYFEDAYSRSISHDLMLMSATLADNIDSRLVVAESALTAAKAALPPTTLANPGLAQTFLNERVTLQSIFPDGILLISSGGRLIARYPAQPGGAGPDYADREFFVSVLTRKITHHSAFLETTGKGAEIVVASPIFSPEGEVIAIMAGIADLTLSKVSIEKLLREKIGEGAHIYIASRDGTYLLHHGDKTHGETIPVSQRPFFEKALAGTEATGEAVDCCNERVLASFQKLAKIDCVLMVSWPLSLAYAPLEKAEGYFLLAIVLGTVLLSTIAWSVTARIVDPLQTMTRHVRALPQLPFGNRLLGFDRDDEVGILAKAFDDLIITLEARQGELVTLNNDLQRRAADLTAKNLELETFSYSLSHDLKAPLTSITLSAEVLMETSACGTSANAASLLSIILAESERMSGLIDAMLTLSRVSLTQMNYEEVNLSELVKETLLRLSMENPDRKAEWTIAPDVTVTGDARLLLSVMENLLGNAWKYCGKKDVTRIEFGVQEGKERVFFIRDNGTGFDMTRAGQLFEPFRQLHDGREFKGFGVGLTTVQRIIQRHGGRIWAEAEPDKGATFYFTLQPDGPVASTPPVVP